MNTILGSVFFIYLFGKKLINKNIKLHSKNALYFFLIAIICHNITVFTVMIANMVLYLYNKYVQNIMSDLNSTTSFKFKTF